MGLFDFFKKKDSQEQTMRDTNHSELFMSISKYSEYIVRFISMQQQGNYAPISAYEKSNNEIGGFLFINSDNTYTLSADEVIKRMETDFERKLQNNEIKSYAIFYHSQFANDNNHKLANNDDELKAISIAYNFFNGLKGKIGLPYSFQNGEVSYLGFGDFTADENSIIFNTQLKENRDYFQEREEVKSEVIENEIGLKIKKANNCDLNNTWCGIFGFESYRKPNGSQILKEHFALAILKAPVYSKNNIDISQIDFNDVSFKAILINETPKTILPIIKTDYCIDVENKEITEWENVANLEAIITGSARDTFGIAYFATDYAENRELYLTKKKLNIKISGIAFVLDLYKDDETEREVKFSDDFTAYMPSNDLPNYGCFDFIGELEDFKETQFLEDSIVKGYIMKVRLITNLEVKDFFTIDIYVTPENMRFKELSKGMKLTGMLQMQGQICNAMITNQFKK